uniref:Uncharacterized protein n=1 Tax=Caenorhabditis tropicalis TaxID=1561998 RepID=A0A1I7UBP2_9PELO
MDILFLGQPAYKRRKLDAIILNDAMIYNKAVQGKICNYAYQCLDLVLEAFLVNWFLLRVIMSTTSTSHRL